MRLEKNAPSQSNSQEKSEKQIEQDRRDRLTDMLRQNNEQQVLPVSFAPPGMRRTR